MAYGAELNRAGGWLDEPDHGKKCADRGGPGHRLGVVVFGERRSSDVEWKLDAIHIISRQVAKIVSRRADPELVDLLVDD